VLFSVGSQIGQAMVNRTLQGGCAVLALVSAALLVDEAIEDGWSRMTVAFLLNLVAFTSLLFVARRAAEHQ
jgi:hypothetical protein